MSKTQRVAVAYSGGRDSTALLHATAVEAQALDVEVEVLALHVHHGLSPNADRWLAHCTDQCARWARRGLPVRFIHTRVQQRPGKGESIEAWARDARYAALHAMAQQQGVGVVLLAHHRRDQAETLLLQALRGAGIAGLASMPASVQRDGVRYERPWLQRRRQDIDAYVARHRLRHIDDESNDDARFARNRLRLQVWPPLIAAFAQAEATLATTATWAQQAKDCLDELADMDLTTCAEADALLVTAWMRLSDARRSNALRAWLAARSDLSVTAALVERLMTELPRCTSARWPLEGGELRCHRGRLSWLAAACAPSPNAPPAHSRETALNVRRAGCYRLPGWGGELTVRRVARDGVPLAWLAQLELRARAGAERFQAGVGRPPRSLKKQFQSAAVPAWQRDGPLVYSGGQLLFVPGLGLDARVLALPGQPQVQFDWSPYTAA